METNGPPSVSIKGFGIWPCELCPETFETEDARAEHRKSHVKFGIQTFKYGKETYIYDKDVAKESIYRNPATYRQEGPYTCLACGVGFKLATDLLHHRSIHADGKTCHICGKETSSAKEYNEHIQNHRNQSINLVYTPNKPQSREKHPDIYEQWTNAFHEAADYYQKSASAVTKGRLIAPKPVMNPMDKPSESKIIKSEVMTVFDTAQSVTGHKSLNSDMNMKFSRSNASSDTFGVPSKEAGLLKINTQGVKQCIQESPIKLDQNSKSGNQVVSSGVSESLNKIKKPYQCIYCPISFKLELSLRRHVELHTGEKPYKCGTCTDGFSTAKELEIHTKATHSLVSTCNICGEKFDHALLNYHMSLHNVHMCTKCPAMFISKEALEYHMKSHQPEETFTCVVCANTYPTFALLESHLEAHRVPSKATRNNDTDFIDLTLAEPMTTGTSDSQQFGKEVGKASDAAQFCTNNGEVVLGTQFILPSPPGKDIQGQQFDADTGNGYQVQQLGTDEDKEFVEFDYVTLKAMPVTDEKSFCCSICPKRYRSCDPLRSHLLTHHGQGSYICPDCGIGFITEEDRKAHVHTDTGTQKKLYGCAVCKKRCLSMPLLRHHMRNHTPRTRYACQHCKKRFRSKPQLYSHIEEHSNLESYRYSEPVSMNSNVIVDMSNVYSNCAICVGGFGNLDELRIHIIQHLQQYGLSLNRH